jgi:SAM-dependent methyltransferase
MISTDTKKLYENKVYGNTGNQEVLDQIPREANSILDVGCGAGDNARILKQLNKYVTCVTISEDEALLVKEICDEVIVSNIESDDFDPGKKFDAIILSHVCEHLVHPAIAISKMSGYLNKNGTITIAVPNIAFYKNRLKLLKGNWTMDESGPFDKTHLHFYSYHSVSAMYDEKQVTLVKRIPGQLAVPLWPLRKLLPALCKKIDHSVGKHFPNLFAQQIILVIRAKN